MYYIVETDKSFDQAVADLDAAVQQHRFGVLHVHDLGATLRGKGIDFADECQVFEVCSPQQAAAVLAIDLRLNMALPCRISVYAQGGRTRIGMLRPQLLLAQLSADPRLAAIAAEVERETRAMIDEAR